MKTLKWIVISLLLLILLLVIIGFSLPRQVTMERSIVINAPKALIFDQVNDLRNWPQWSPWHGRDTNMQVEYFNGGIGEGSSFSWSSPKKDVGSGKLTITHIVGLDSIFNEMDFGEQGLAKAWYVFEDKESSTKVTWGFHSDMGNSPIARWVGLFMEDMLSPDYEQGLKSLKKLSEELNTSTWFPVNLQNRASKQYLSIINTTSSKNIGTAMGEMYETISMEMNALNLKPQGAPFAIYHSFGDEVKIECGIPCQVKEQVQFNAIELKEYPSGTYASLHHMGSYSNLNKVHSYLANWIQKHDLKINGFPMEVYQTDPTQEPNPEKWITEVLYPVK